MLKYTEEPVQNGVVWLFVLAELCANSWTIIPVEKDTQRHNAKHALTYTKLRSSAKL